MLITIFECCLIDDITIHWRWPRLHFTRHSCHHCIGRRNAIEIAKLWITTGRLPYFQLSEQCSASLTKQPKTSKKKKKIICIKIKSTISTKFVLFFFLSHSVRRHQPKWANETHTCGSRLIKSISFNCESCTPSSLKTRSISGIDGNLNCFTVNCSHARTWSRFHFSGSAIQIKMNRGLAKEKELNFVEKTATQHQSKLVLFFYYFLLLLLLITYA